MLGLHFESSAWAPASSSGVIVDVVVAVHVGRHGAPTISRRTGKASFAVIDDLDEYRATNLRNWESRVPVHAASHDYNLAGLAADPERLSGVVAYDRPGLGDLAGLDVVHVQCHIGTDTVSLARLGGRVTGVDFSPSALAVARDLAGAGGVDVRFVESELYAIPERARRASSTSFTPAWARSAGSPTSRAGHAWSPGCSGPAGVSTSARASDADHARRRRADDVLPVAFAVLRGEAVRWVSDQTYTDGPPIGSPEQFEWNHGLGEIVQAVIDAGLQ